MTTGRNQLTEVKGTESRIKHLIEDDKIDAIDVALVRGLSTIVYTVVSNKTNPVYARLDRLSDEKIVKKYERPGQSTHFSVDNDTAAEKLLSIIDSDDRLKQKYSMNLFSVMGVVLEHMETNDKLMSDIAFPLNKKLLRTGYDERKDYIDFHVLQ